MLQEPQRNCNFTFQITSTCIPSFKLTCTVYMYSLFVRTSLFRSCDATLKSFFFQVLSLLSHVCMNANIFIRIDKETIFKKWHDLKWVISTFTVALWKRKQKCWFSMKANIFLLILEKIITCMGLIFLVYLLCIYIISYKFSFTVNYWSQNLLEETMSLPV